MKTRKRCWHRLYLFCITFFLLSCIFSYLLCIEYEFDSYEQKTQVFPAALDSVPLDYVLELREFIGATSNHHLQTNNLWEFYHYNALRSDRIGAFRALPDTRDSSCTTRPYNVNIRHSRVSVIIAFHNEARSTLLRTIMSLYYRTTAQYLHEIILIDDCSDDAYLLSEMLRLNLPPFMQNVSSFSRIKSSNAHSATKEKSLIPKVTIKAMRNIQRLGVIASRNRGAHLATGDYILFLDSHCEVNVGWLEPLLERVARSGDTTADIGGDGAGNVMVAVSPVLDSIDAESLEYIATSENLMGGFDWNLHFHWISRTQSVQSQEIQQQAEKPLHIKQQQKSAQTFNRKASVKIVRNKYINAKAFKSPTFAGGIFMISRQWFFKLNGFNPLLETWGGESIEFSIKFWLCGGQIEIVSCSRVGHIFRKRHPFHFPNGSDSQTTYLRNSKIIAESWLDAYKFFFYSSKPAARHININMTDIQRNHQLRSALKCRPFSWYLQHVFPELKLPNDDFTAFGTLSSGELCLQITNHVINVNEDVSQLRMSSCYHSDVTHWYLHRKSSQLQASSGLCLNVVVVGEVSKVTKVETLLKSSMHPKHLHVVLQQCNEYDYLDDENGHNQSVNQKQKQSQRWLRRGGWLVHQQTQLCLDNPLSNMVVVSHCRHNAAPSQLFRFTMELQRL